MEEMNKNIDTVTEIVEEATDKLTLKQNIAAYGMAGVFGMGVLATGYGIFKGGKKLYKAIRGKKNDVSGSEEDAVDVDYEEIHEVKDNETEQD